MTPSMSALPRVSKELEKNTWADYIELLCLINPDGEISLSDLSEINKVEDLTDQELRDYDTAERADSRYQQLFDVFQYIQSRVRIFADDYPFELIDEDTIRVKTNSPTISQLFYLFLLYASNLSRFEKSEQYVLTSNFELISREVLKYVYPNFTVEVFGTASKPDDLFYGGKLIEKLKKLSSFLNTEITDAVKNNPRYDQTCGDAGIDLVGFAPLDRDSYGAPFVPMIFAQCACSHDQWKEKQSSIKYDYIKPRFSNLAPYCEIIAVPFSLRDTTGQWDNTELDRIVVIPVDRVRFLHILSLYGSDFSFFDNSDAYRLIVESLGQLGW